jgi:hypothetical protein
VPGLHRLAIMANVDLPSAEMEMARRREEIDHLGVFREPPFVALTSIESTDRPMTLTATSDNQILKSNIRN